ncbi:hypothetical protein IFM89_006994 [Coptis chinensis]|uniref:SANT domain-containing protein n=1 Tax=Coptis chinensis TaxID=261450 RepID=A0A835MA48_9MAGN|nr:hypothetical protein IFM89_006994 [Coptis chinensis]
MATKRKSRNLNKLCTKGSKDAGNVEKNQKQKRNVSDILGDQWSKEELRRFYEAYRKYEKNWKKVAARVRNRSVEMVEALYDMNRAYLSLPDGTATVVGLIAMMTDHYNSLVRWLILMWFVSKQDSENESKSESESDEDPRISQKAQKSDRRKVQVNVSKGSFGHHRHNLHSQEVASGDGCLSLLKNKCSSDIGPRIVGKRTPRIPVSNPYNKGDRGKYFSQSKRDRNQEGYFKANEVAQEALALTKVWRRESFSETPNRRPERVRRCPVWKYGDVDTKGETVGSKHAGAAKGCYFEIGKKKQFSKKKPKDHAIKEMCSGTKKLILSTDKGKSETRATDAQIGFSSHLGTKKRSRQLLSEDESSALDALNTLADALLNLEPTSIAESDLGIGAKENGGHQSMDGVDSSLENGVIPEAKKRVHQSTSEIQKGNGKSLSSKTKKSESAMDSFVEEQQKTENPKAEAQMDSLLIAEHRIEDKSVGPQESSSLRVDLPSEGNNISLPMVQVPKVNQVHLPMKPSKRKTQLKNAVTRKRIRSQENIGSGHFNAYSSSLHDRAWSLKENLSHCLSSQALRRWCAFEWYYSAIDYPWYAKREFVEYLNHVGLGQVPKLTRVEWGVIRSSLGKPRRLSQQFLREEKDKLERYRDSVRGHYAELRSGIRDVTPSDLARPLRVGQRVIACHPKTKGIYDGSILTVERNKCRVQFDRLELGVELVMDIDCMPSNLLKSIPEAVRRENISAVKNHNNFSESINSQSKGWRFGGHPRCASGENLECTASPSFFSSPTHPANSYLMLAKCEIACEVRNVPETIKSRDADIQALSDLSRALDKKVSCALDYLRQRNTHQENATRLGLKPISSSGTAEPHSFFDHCAFRAQESECHVVETVARSRWKARRMVDAAVQAMSSLEEGEDVYVKIEEAINFADIWYSGVYSSAPATSSFDPPNSCDLDLTYQKQETPGMAEQRTEVQTTGSKLNNASEASKIQIPSALISSCVATLLMIQTCTDRQYPPGEAVQILDSAMRSLQPCCSQNVPIYRDIQMCMGMVKNQILSLIPI